MSFDLQSGYAFLNFAVTSRQSGLAKRNPQQALKTKKKRG